MKKHLLPKRPLSILEKVMRDALEKHGPDGWKHWPITTHIAHAERHLTMWRAGDTSEDHLSHAACRLWLALALKGKQ